MPIGCAANLMTSEGGQWVTEVIGGREREREGEKERKREGEMHIAAGRNHTGKLDELMLSNPYRSTLCGSFALFLSTAPACYLK